MKQTKNTAFTLVELIVVITILAVLATVAFISFQGYSQQARDSVRLADMQNITKAFEFIKTKDQQLPIPDKKIDITASGTIFQYQGVLELTTLEKSGVHNGGIDPLTLDPYGYAVNFARNKFQLIGFLENSESVANNMFAQSFADNSDTYIKTSGDALGILLDNSTKEIIIQTDTLTQVDVVNDTTEYTLEIDNSTDTIYNQKKLLSLHNISGSCKQILKNNPNATSGVYTIKLDGFTDTPVYCDMVTDGGGWTLVVKRKHSSNNVEDCGVNLNDFLQNPCNDQTLTSGNVFDNTSYSLGELGLNLHTNEYMVMQYSSGGVLDSDDAYILNTPNNLFPDSAALHHIPINSVCSLDKTQCDSTDVVWKYVGTNHFNSGWCDGGLGLSYGGNYGYCHNGANGNKNIIHRYNSNLFIGDRAGYDESKLRGYNANGYISYQYQEFIYVR